MTAPSLDIVLGWLAVASLVGAGVAAFSALAARSLFSMAVYLAAMSALAAAAVLALGGGDGALALAGVGAGFAPLLLLGAVLLSVQAARPGKRSLALLAILAAVGGAAVAALLAPELAGASGSGAASDPVAATMFAAVTVFVAAVTCVGLLGYGERGVLDHPEREE